MDSRESLWLPLDLVGLGQEVPVLLVGSRHRGQPESARVRGVSTAVLGLSQALGGQARCKAVSPVTAGPQWGQNATCSLLGPQPRVCVLRF